MPGWASLWLLSALSTLSLLRQAKINWVDSEVGAVSHFTTFHLREWNCSRVFLALFLLRKLGFSMKPFLLLWPLTTWDVSNILHGFRWQLWLRHRCFLRVSPKPSSFGCTSHSGTGASSGFHQSPLPAVASCLMVTLLYLGIFGASSFVFVLFRFLVVFVWLVSTLVLVALCTFLHNLLMLNISFGCCRHSVSNTFVQLTEGRSARDKPKQLPAKKNKFVCVWVWSSRNYRRFFFFLLTSIKANHGF